MYKFTRGKPPQTIGTVYADHQPAALKAGRWPALAQPSARIVWTETWTDDGVRRRTTYRLPHATAPQAAQQARQALAALVAAYGAPRCRAGSYAALDAHRALR